MGVSSVDCNEPNLASTEEADASAKIIAAAACCILPLSAFFLLLRGNEKWNDPDKSHPPSQERTLVEYIVVPLCPANQHGT